MNNNNNNLYKIQIIFYIRDWLGELWDKCSTVFILAVPLIPITSVRPKINYNF